MSTLRTAAPARLHARRVSTQGHGIRIVARVGLGSRAVVYFLLAYLAFKIAVNGHSPAPTSGKGALQELAAQPGGTVILLLLAIGLGAYAIWRFLLVLGIGDPNSRTTWTKRIGWMAIAVIYALLCVQAVALVTGSSHSSSGGTANHPAPLVGTALGWPGGQWIVAIAGLALLGGGLGLAIWGCIHNHGRDLDARAGKKIRSIVRGTGAAGNTARGLWIALVAWYVLEAAATDKANHVKGLDAALLALKHDSGGTALIAVGAVGLLCFAVFSCLEAVYRRV